MGENFTVSHVALHLIDRGLPGPQSAGQEVDLTAFTDPADAEALSDFFEGHLQKAWEAEESRRTLAGSFKPGSPLPQHYTDIKATPGLFYGRSEEMAQLLYDKAKGKTYSSGILMVLWFHHKKEERPFLGLFKMDPGPSHKIILRRRDAGSALLQLAVRHLEQALPDPRDQVLKWAIIPHPSRPTFHVKAKDQEGANDLAQYFVEFLGCQQKPSEKEQFETLQDQMRAYLAAVLPRADWRQLEAELETEPVVTLDTVLEATKRLAALRPDETKKLREHLTESGAADLAITAQTWRRTRLEYHLPSGIVIRGPRAVMEDEVQLIQQDGGLEIRITTPDSKDLRKRYV